MYRRHLSNGAGPVHVDPEPLPIPEDPASLLLTDRAVMDIARVASEHGIGASGL